MVLKEVKQLEQQKQQEQDQLYSAPDGSDPGYVSFEQLSSGGGPAGSGSSGGPADPIPLGQVDEYLAGAVADDTLPFYAPLVGLSAARSRAYLRDQIGLFAYAAGRDLSRREADLLVDADLSVRRTSAHIVAAALGLAAAQTARSYARGTLADPPRWAPEAFRGAGSVAPAAAKGASAEAAAAAVAAARRNIRFGPLAGGAARAAWASARLAFTLPLWLAGAQLVAMPVMTGSAVRMARHGELRALHEQVRRGLAAQVDRGVPLATVVNEAARATRAAIAAGGAGDGEQQQWQQQQQQQAREASPVLSAIGKSGGFGRQQQQRWGQPADSVVDDLVGPGGDDDGQSPVARDGAGRPGRPRLSGSWDSVRQGAAQTQAGDGWGEAGGEKRSWEQVRREAK